MCHSYELTKNSRKSHSLPLHFRLLPHLYNIPPSFQDWPRRKRVILGSVMVSGILASGEKSPTCAEIMSQTRSSEIQAIWMVIDRCNSYPNGIAICSLKLFTLYQNLQPYFAVIIAGFAKAIEIHCTYGPRSMEIVYCLQIKPTPDTRWAMSKLCLACYQKGRKVGPHIVLCAGVRKYFI